MHAFPVALLIYLGQLNPDLTLAFTRETRPEITTEIIAIGLTLNQEFTKLLVKDFSKNDSQFSPITFAMSSSLNP